MKASERLGAFGGTPTTQPHDDPDQGPRSPRNKAKAQAQGDIPMYDLVLLYLDEIATTPLNPRHDFGTGEELTTLGQGLAKTQLQPCAAVDAQDYLRIWPEHAGHVGTARYVLINGERRLRSARHVGLEKLAFTLRTDLTVIRGGNLEDARARLLDAVLKENIDRKQFDPIEEAMGVAAFVDLFGDGVRAGQQLGRDKTWVSSRLALLRLPADLQRQVARGDVKVKAARWMAARINENPALTADQLLTMYETHLAAAALRAAVATGEPAAATGGLIPTNPGVSTTADSRPAERLIPVNRDVSTTVDAPPADRLIPINPPAARTPTPATPPPTAVPEQREQPAPAPAPAAIKDWRDTEHIVTTILEEMEPKAILKLIEELAVRIRPLMSSEP